MPRATNPIRRPVRKLLSDFDQSLEFAKMAWAPVLRELGSDARMKELAERPYVVSVRPLAWWTSVKSPGTASPGPVKWITADQIIQIHDEMIRAFGGEGGILDQGKVESALDRIRYSKVAGTDVFPTVIHKAAALLHSILLYHPFVDGQKRTGISLAFIFLRLNDYLLWSRDVADEIHFAVRVAQGDFEVDQIAEWIASRVAPGKFLEWGRRERLAPEETLDWARVDALSGGKFAFQRKCVKCGRFVKINSYEVQCSCGEKYVVILNGVLETRAKNKTHLIIDAFLLNPKVIGNAVKRLSEREPLKSGPYGLTLVRRPYRVRAECHVCSWTGSWHYADLLWSGGVDPNHASRKEAELHFMEKHPLIGEAR